MVHIFIYDKWVEKFVYLGLHSFGGKYENKYIKIFTSFRKQQFNDFVYDLQALSFPSTRPCNDVDVFILPRRLQHSEKGLRERLKRTYKFLRLAYHILNCSRQCRRYVYAILTVNILLVLLEEKRENSYEFVKMKSSLKMLKAWLYMGSFKHYIQYELVIYNRAVTKSSFVSGSWFIYNAISTCTLKQSEHE